MSLAALTIAPCKEIEDSMLWIQDFRYWIPDSLSCIPDSITEDSGFHSKHLMDSGVHKRTFPGFRNPDSLKWGVSPSYPASSFPVTSAHSSRLVCAVRKGQRLEVRDWGRVIRFEDFNYVRF